VRDRGLVEVKGVVTAASNTNAAVYFLDARDLTPRALTASGDARHSAGISEAGQLQQGRFFGAEASEQLALETGGTSIRGGDLAAGLKRLADESRSYYLLGYSPGDPSLDGKFRAIEVKVRQPGLSVRARRGYYAVARPGPTPANVAVTAAAATRPSAAAPDVSSATVSEDLFISQYGRLQRSLSQTGLPPVGPGYRAAAPQCGVQPD